MTTHLLSILATLMIASHAFAASTEKVIFSQKNSDLQSIAIEIGKKTGKTFIIDPQAKARMVILPPGPLNVDEAFDAFLIALSMESLTIVEDGRFTRISLAQNAQRSNIETVTELPTDSHERMMTYIYQAKYVSAHEVFNNLGPALMSRVGEMRVFEHTNQIIVTDFLSNLRRIDKILKLVDISKK